MLDGQFESLATFGPSSLSDTDLLAVIMGTRHQVVMRELVGRVDLGREEWT
jgi:DNA repair protein RadC